MSALAQHLPVFVAFMGTVMALHMESSRRLDAIQSDMKGFYGRLAAIEEIGRRILEKNEQTHIPLDKSQR